MVVRTFWRNVVIFWRQNIAKFWRLRTTANWQQHCIKRSPLAPKLDMLPVCQFSHRAEGPVWAYASPKGERKRAVRVASKWWMDRLRSVASQNGLQTRLKPVPTSSEPVSSTSLTLSQTGLGQNPSTSRRVPSRRRWNVWTSSAANVNLPSPAVLNDFFHTNIWSSANNYLFQNS